MEIVERKQNSVSMALLSNNSENSNVEMVNFLLQTSDSILLFIRLFVLFVSNAKFKLKSDDLTFISILINVFDYLLISLLFFLFSLFEMDKKSLLVIGIRKKIFPMVGIQLLNPW